MSSQQWHGYIAVEALDLNQSQKQTLVAALEALGPTSHRSPACMNHSRTRLDGDAVIFEALFDQDDLTVAQFKQWLGNIFSVDPDDIAHSTGSASFSGEVTPIVTFEYPVGTDRLRLALFGGVSTTWVKSGNEARGYLKLYQDEWEPTE